MGTKSRDAFFWLMLLALTGAIFTKSKLLFGAALLFAAGLVYFSFYVSAAKKRSREMGLKFVVLLPVSRFYAKLLLKISKAELFGKWDEAYEIHLIVEGEDYYNSVNDDLNWLKNNVPALYIWETSAPIPSSIRAFIRKNRPLKKAVWKKGAWMPLPPAPSTGREIIKKNITHGAICVEF